MSLLPIDEISKYTNRNYEIEVKFKNVSVGTFYRILNNFPKSNPIETLDTTISDIRITQNTDGTEIYIKKNRIYNKENEWGLKITISEEIPVIIKPTGNTTSIRRKRRWSFKYENTQLDMTWVTDEILKKDSWEIEVELKSNNASDLNKPVTQILSLIQDTKILYTQNLKNQIINDWNNLLGGKGNQVFDHNILNKPINLRRKNMTHGIIDNYYTITQKINGIEKCLYFHTSGVWLIHPPQDANFLMKHTNETKEYIGTCLLGEITYGIDTMIYIPYDILSWKGDKSIQKYNHLLDRLPKCKEISDKKLFNPMLMEIFMKEFVYVGKTPENFGAAYEYIVELGKISGQKIDGYILTPIQESYVSSKIFKIKNFDELTIDFKIINGQITTVQKDDDETKYVVFNGEVCNTFDPNTQIDWGNFTNLEGNVVEFKPVKKDDKIYLTPTRIRYDKTSPNSTITARNIWDEIESPWSEKTLLALDFNRLYYQNNRLKTEIFENISGIIVDIGSGRGGDVTKWKKADKVLCIEPDLENFIELNRRILCNNLQNKITTLNCKGQDTDIIIKELKKILPNNNVSITVSMMLSLSFFWKNKYTLDSLQNTLISISQLSNQNTYFNFFTIDGQRTLELFEKYGRNLQLGPATMDFLPIRGGISLNGTVDINIQDSIVNEQTEYLVNLNDMECLQKPITVYNSVKEEYLTEQEKIFGNLFIYGNSIINKNNIILEMVEPISFSYLGTAQNTPTQPDKVVNVGVKGGVRISTIKEGGNFFHALLNAISPTYQESNYFGRMQIVKNLRNDLADYMKLPNQNNKKAGIDSRPYFKDTESLDVNSNFFTLDKLTQLYYSKYLIAGSQVSDGYNVFIRELQSNNDLDYLSLDFISEVFNINIIFKNTEDNITVKDVGSFKSNIPGSKTVIIYLHQNYTYETMGLRNSSTGLIQTVF